MKNVKDKKEKIIFIFCIIFCIISIFSCVFVKSNSNFLLLFILALLKGLPMLFILLLAINEANKNNKISIYEKLFLPVFISSLLSDITLVFNVVIGGAFSLLSMLLITIAFLRHRSFYFLIFKKKKEISHQIISGIVVMIISFLFFIIYSLIFIFPKMPDSMLFLKFLFPVYMLFLSVAVGSSFFGKTLPIVRIGIILFFISDALLFYGFSFGFSSLLTICNLVLYYSAQIIFAKKIDE